MHFDEQTGILTITEGGERTAMHQERTVSTTPRLHFPARSKLERIFVQPYVGEDQNLVNHVIQAYLAQNIPFTSGREIAHWFKVQVGAKVGFDISTKMRVAKAAIRYLDEKNAFLESERQYIKDAYQWI